MNAKNLALLTLAPSLALISACNPASEVADLASDSEANALLAGINVSDARLVLSPVSGNPAAVYFDLTYLGDATVSLESASVEGAKSAMIHKIAEDGGHMMAAGPVELASGKTFKLEPGGFHVMAMGPSTELEASEVTKVTLEMSDGTSHTFEAEIRAAGEER